MPEIFPTAIYPNYSLVKIPEFDTNIIDYGNKVEQRISKWSDPKYKFRVKWNSLGLGNKKTILDFFLARKGAYEAFYFRNVEEISNADAWTALTNYSAGDIVVPTTADGHSYKVTTDGGSSGASEPLWSTTEKTTTNDGGLVWTENSYLVRFETDSVNIELFEYNLYNYNEITLIEVSA